MATEIVLRHEGDLYETGVTVEELNALVSAYGEASRNLIVEAMLALVSLRQAAGGPVPNAMVWAAVPGAVARLRAARDAVTAALDPLAGDTADD